MFKREDTAEYLGCLDPADAQILQICSAGSPEFSSRPMPISIEAAVLRSCRGSPTCCNAIYAVQMVMFGTRLRPHFSQHYSFISPTCFKHVCCYRFLRCPRCCASQGTIHPGQSYDSVTNWMMSTVLWMLWKRQWRSALRRSRLRLAIECMPVMFARIRVVRANYVVNVFAVIRPRFLSISRMKSCRLAVDRHISSVRYTGMSPSVERGLLECRHSHMHAPLYHMYRFLNGVFRRLIKYCVASGREELVDSPLHSHACSVFRSRGIAVSPGSLRGIQIP